MQKILLDLPSNKSPKDTTIVVAMSGGVDSSVVACLLKESGYNVIGITLQLYDYGTYTGTKTKTCCAGQDIYDAKMVCSKIQIPHYVLDYESKFKESVIDDFVDSYSRGETPLPCVRCNQSVKFKDLVKVAKDLGADGLATGHYVKKIIGKNGSELHKGLDQKKDQSYFLFTITKEQLDFLHFPLGSMTKNETRLHASRFGLDIADKPDSQDICFVPNGKYQELIKKIKPEVEIPGKIFHVNGYYLGTHSGIINYTIGQRKGLGIAANSENTDPLYVVKIDPETNSIFVGGEMDLKTQKFLIKEVNLLLDDGFGIQEKDSTRKDFTVKIRSSHAGVLAKLKKINDEHMEVELMDSQKSVTPGQACVIYDETRLIGGGFICR